jgi:hypothetical protein
MFIAVMAYLVWDIAMAKIPLMIALAVCVVFVLIGFVTCLRSDTDDELLSGTSRERPSKAMPQWARECVQICRLIVIGLLAWGIYWAATAVNKPTDSSSSFVEESTEVTSVLKSEEPSSTPTAVSTPMVSLGLPLTPEPSPELSPKPTSSNLWLQAEVHSAATNDGARAYILFDKTDLDNMSDEDYMEFCDTTVSEAKKGGYQYFTVCYQDGTGLVFPNCSTEIANYGELNDDGLIAELQYSIKYKNGVISYDVPTPSPSPSPSPTPSPSPSPTVTLAPNQGSIIAPTTKIQNMLSSVQIPSFNAGDVLEFCYGTSEGNYIASVITYNEKDQKVSVIGYNADLSVGKYGRINYDANGYITSEEQYYDAAETHLFRTIEYTYDNDGILKESRTYDENGVFDDSQSYFRTGYTQTADGELATLEMRRYDEKIYYVREYRDGEAVKETRYNKDGSVWYSRETTYDSNGRESEITFYDSKGKYDYAICYLQTS